MPSFASAGDSTPEVIADDDRQRAFSTLTLAFAADPFMRWFWPDPHRYATEFPTFAEAYGGRAFEHATAHQLSDGRAVTLWLPPGVEPDEMALGAQLGASLPEATLLDLAQMLEQMAGVHPTGDHWYLTVAGVDPAAQGGGLGTSLLRHGLALIDESSLPAYLEASSPRNRRLYERLGFRVVADIQAGSSPTVWAMLRDPAPTT